MDDHSSGEDLQAVVTESRRWIEAVTGKTLVGEFRESLEDGIVLCELVNALNPGCIRKINLKRIAIAHLDNLKQFLTACENLGLKGSQLFDLTDLQAPGTLRMKSGGVKHTTAERRLRNVVITLYWLGRKASQMPDYYGPQLDLEAFKEMLDIPNQSYYLKGYNGNVSPIPPVKSSPSPTNLSYNKQTPPPGKSKSATPPPVGKSKPATPPPPAVKKLATPPPPTKDTPTTTDGFNELSADELLANIQSAVDELLNECQESSVIESTSNDRTFPTSDGHLSLLVKITARHGSFGLQIIGGADTALPAQIELLLAGGPAESSGLLPGDLIISVNGQDVSAHNHFDLIDLIKQSSARGTLELGVVRRQSDSVEVSEERVGPFRRAESRLIWEEENAERQRQQREVQMLYKNRGWRRETTPEREQEITTTPVIKEESKSIVMEELRDEFDNWEEILEEQLQIDNDSSATKPLDDLQQQLEALNSLANFKPSHIAATVPVINQHEEKVIKYEQIEEEEDSYNEKEEDVEHERIEGEGKEDDPVIITKEPHPRSSVTEDDPFAPLQTTSPQPELLQEVLSAKTSIANNFNSSNISSTSVSKNESLTKTTFSNNTMPFTIPNLKHTTNTKDFSTTNTKEYSTPNARVISMNFDSDDIEEIQGIKVKAVQKTRWTPEAKENRKVMRNSSGSRGSRATNDIHEVVVVDSRGRSVSNTVPETHSRFYNTRPSSGHNTKQNKVPNCSHCRRPISQGAMMAIPTKNLSFHTNCLMCIVCKRQITIGYGHTTVFLRHSLPHCASCYSTDNGIRATTC